ncbi:MAG: pyridoxamine 5'-phosphate oxidase family protein [Promethearchaeota archaeon]|nr:MAG: pyridoxamine 5'-phosphate oxidase family protein [Candidatus Lokiarchaeota archaeon]
MAKYHMRRIEKELKDKQDLKKILKDGKYTIISLCKENEPYIVALSYGYDESKHALYIHCAKEGQKIDFITANPHVCGIVIEDNGYKEECGQTYRSVVFRGKMEVVRDIQEKKYGFDVLLNQLEENPNTIKNKFLKKDETYENSGMLRVDIIDITGKEEKAESQ